MTTKKKTVLEKRLFEIIDSMNEVSGTELDNAVSAIQRFGTAKARASELEKTN